MKDDPLFCHSSGKTSKDRCDEVCKFFGDLQLSHFRDQDIRDWIDSVTCAWREESGATDDDGALAWYQEITDGAEAVDVPVVPAVVAEEDGFMSRRLGVTADPDIVPHLNAAWDPLFAAELHNNRIPVNVSMKSKHQLQSRFENEFPKTWKNLMTTDDMTFARKQAAKGAQGLKGPALQSYLKNINDKYAEHLTERVLQNRSSFISGGLLEQAMAEMLNPSKSSRRTKAQKRVQEFISNFDQTAEYFKRSNPELQDNAHVLREILRNYIQPLAASDAAELKNTLKMLFPKMKLLLQKHWMNLEID